MFKAGAVGLALLAGTWAAQATEYAVSSEREFEGALKSVQPGDAIVFRNGTWQDVKLNFRADGEEGKPVILRAETPGRVIFGGSSQLLIDGSHLVVSGFKFQDNSNVTEIVTPYNVRVASVVTFTTNSSHCRLTETAIRDSGEGVSTYVHLRPGSVSNRVDHCYFSNQGAIGMTFYVEAHPSRPNGHLVDHNYFGDRKPGRGNRWETLRIGHSEQQQFVSATTVAHNYFYRCNGENENVSNKSTGNRYLYNSFIENRGQLCLRHGDKAWIEGNYFFGGNEPAAQGVRMSGSDHVVINNYFDHIRDAMLVYNGQDNPEVRGYLPVNNTLIGFNTFVDCSNNFVLGIGGRGRSIVPRNLRIAGNLVRAQSGEIIQTRAQGIDVKYEGNILFGAPPGVQRQPGITTNAPALKTDEWGRVFPDASQSSLRLPIENFPQVTQDMNGTARGSESTVGAIGERSAAPLYPLSKRDVGPRWMAMNNGR